MPLYQYKCQWCDRITEGMRTVQERGFTPECYFCGKATTLIVSPVRGIVKNPAVPRGKP